MSNYTKLSVTNQKNEAVEVYVTFAASNSSNTCCGNPAKVSDFSKLTEIHKLMGKFTLPARSTYEFDPKGKCFSGNICFYIAPQCPVKGANFNNGKQGTSIAEFTLNPSKGCDEAFDISCVNGVNSFIEMKVDKDGGWNYGPGKKSINMIYNKDLGLNSGNPGVFPVNCTDCIQLVGNKPCPDLPLGLPQTERICNVQRSGRGGILQVILTDSQPA